MLVSDYTRVAVPVIRVGTWIAGKRDATKLKPTFISRKVTLLAHNHDNNEPSHSKQQQGTAHARC